MRRAPLVALVVLAAACSSAGRHAAPTSLPRARGTTSTHPKGSTTASSTSTTTTTDTTPESSSTTAPTTASTTNTTGTNAPPATHSLRGAVITINPGHDGGNASHTTQINKMVWIGTGSKACDTVGTETNDGYPEHSFNWDVSLRVAARLRALGATVHLTRTTDTGVGPCIDERARIGNRANSAAVVSIHADGEPASARGFFVIAPTLITGLTDDVYSSSGRLAASVRDAVRRDTAMPTSNYIGSNGYETSGIYGGLNLANVPAMFIECGNMRNATDAALLETPSFREQLAGAIVAGISAFVS